MKPIKFQAQKAQIDPLLKDLYTREFRIFSKQGAHRQTCLERNESRFGTGIALNKASDHSGLVKPDRINLA